MNHDPLRIFVDCAIEKGDFHPDSKQDRHLFKKMSEAFHALMTQKDGHERFEQLLHHHSPHVRLWAATQMICVGHAAAHGVLDSLAAHSGYPGSTARLVLSEYLQGRLRPPFG
ncbi:MAG: DUF2019 domain-containing protein [Saprospiraceae bacterium]|nr:DUF2019 domain-containing protein [Saprospiraceae bacterium]